MLTELLKQEEPGKLKEHEKRNEAVDAVHRIFRIAIR
jgi:hypothetical protein